MMQLLLEFDQTVNVGEVGQLAGATQEPLFHLKYWQVDPVAPQSDCRAVVQSCDRAAGRSSRITMRKR
jgi:hypothetical protein